MQSASAHRRTRVFEGERERDRAKDGERGRDDFGQLPALPATDTNQSCDSKAAPPSSSSSSLSEEEETSPHFSKQEDQLRMPCLKDSNGIMRQA